MSKDENAFPLYIDFTPDHARTPELVDGVRDIYRKELEDQLPAIIERQKELPTLMLDVSGEHVRLLIEARDLFCHAYFYSCVAMCGIVAERILKDTLRRHIFVATDDQISQPSEKAFDQLEHVDISSITKFLSESELIDPEAKSAAETISRLRNKYAHARGESPEADALKAIRHLHTLVAHTVSVLKHFTIKEGYLVPHKPESDGPSEKTS